jgi:hypothetical protein
MPAILSDTVACVPFLAQSPAECRYTKTYDRCVIKVLLSQRASNESNESRFDPFAAHWCCRLANGSAPFNFQRPATVGHSTPIVFFDLLQRHRRCSRQWGRLPGWSQTFGQQSLATRLAPILWTSAWKFRRNGHANDHRFARDGSTNVKRLAQRVHGSTQRTLRQWHESNQRGQVVGSIRSSAVSAGRQIWCRL